MYLRKMVGLGSAFLLIFILTQADSNPDLRTAQLLESAVNSHSKQNKPVVVIIDPYKHYLEFLHRIRTDRSGREEEDEVDDAKEDAKSVFFSYLRTSESDPEIEKHKSSLRSALRARCNKVSSCVRKCPPKKPSCSASCQEVFDSMDLCNPPKKKKKKTYKVTYEFDCEESDECGGDKYGKTMPPRWRMMRHRNK